MFLSVSSQFCCWLPLDPSSRRRPCLKLVVSVTRIYKLIIWTLVLLQRTCTSSVHAHAGRTPRIGADGRHTRVSGLFFRPPLNLRPLGVGNVSFWNSVDTLTILARYAPYAFIVAGFLIAVTGQYVQSFLNDRVEVLKQEIEVVRKKTPPNYDASMRLGPDGKFKVAIKTNTQVPVQVTWLFLTKHNVVVSGVMLQPESLHPTAMKRSWLYDAPIQLDRVVDGILELHFDFTSVYSAELGHPPGLKGKLKHGYRLKDGQLQPWP
jgi:hypothetical protein